MTSHFFQIMNPWLIILIVICSLPAILTGVYKSEYKDENINHGTKICNKTIIYSVKTTEEYNYTYNEPYTGWCWGRPFFCTKYRMKNRTESKDVITYKNKTVPDCCPGYKSSKGKCHPICQNGCIHGQCIEPNKCLCSKGWEGLNCTQECQEGRYGRSCSNYCLCKNGGKCDSKNGYCYCPSGFTGTYCETTCPENSFGKNCENSCKCKNGAKCNPNNGSCECLPGYIGKHCKDRCFKGTFGKDCKYFCKCNSDGTESCSHIDGSCQCKPGWRGVSCNLKCKNTTWGPLCKNNCDCGLNSTCDPVTGACSCFPGWHGAKCEKKCPVGFFEKECKMKCPDCLHNPGTCHHETGWCNCPDGSTRPECDLECPAGKYGKNCQHDCLCTNNSTCDPVTGECLCLPGWMGVECEFPCPEGTYGRNCNFTCDCPNTLFCNKINGSCDCDEMSKNATCVKESGLFRDESPIFVFVILVIIVCIFITVCVVLLMLFIRRKTKLSSLIKCTKSDTAKSNVESTENSSPFNVKKFMNPVYEALNNISKINRKSVAHVSPLGILQDDECREDIIDENNFKIPEINTEICKDPKENLKVDFQFERFDQSNQNRMSTLPKVKFSKSENRDDDTDHYSSPKSSIYGDVDISEENPYEKAK